MLCSQNCLLKTGKEAELNIRKVADIVIILQNRNKLTEIWKMKNRQLKKAEVPS